MTTTKEVLEEFIKNNVSNYSEICFDLIYERIKEMVAMMRLQCSSEGRLRSFTGKPKSTEVTLLKRAFFADGAPWFKLGSARVGWARPINDESGDNEGDVRRS